MQFTRLHYGMAASIAALVVAAPIAMRTMQQHDAVYRRVNAQAPAPATPVPERTTPAQKAQPLDGRLEGDNGAGKGASAPASRVAQGAAGAQTSASPAAAPAPEAVSPAVTAAGSSAAAEQKPNEPVSNGPVSNGPVSNDRAVKDGPASAPASRGVQPPVADSAQAPGKPAAAPAPDAAAADSQRSMALSADKEAAQAKSAAEFDQRRADKQEEAKKRSADRKLDGDKTALLNKTPGTAAAPPPPVAVAPAKPALVVPHNGAGVRARDEGRVAVQLGGHVGDQRMVTYMPRPDPAPVQVEQNRDQFQAAPDNPVKQVAAEPVSTFSIDVDTASYSFVRRALNSGHLPPKDAVRVEEMINYFPYDYTRPESAEVPFQPSVSVYPAPWNTSHKLVHIGLKGYELKSAERPRANIVLLIDTSGSMQPEDRLPLLKTAFRMLVDELKPDDTVSIVTYAGDTRVALEPTKVADKARIVSAIDGLHAGGGTYGEGGIKKAYELAEASFDPKGVNRIVLGTDGDFNIGISNRDELKGYIERKREKGVFLSIVGVGRDNYNDALMQTLAQNGNGTAAYVDTLNEARKVLVEEASSTLFPIAKDVKIQVEFNPAVVSEYRLIGYETRLLKREDFNNDKVDAGDVGSGHTITAIYEVTPVGAPPAVDPLRYGQAEAKRAIDAPNAGSAELGFLKLRYKLPKEDASKLLTLAIGPQQTKASVSEAPVDARFSTAVAAFGQLLRGSPYLGGYSYDDVLALAQGARGEDRFGYRAEFMNLVRLAKSARK